MKKYNFNLNAVLNIRESIEQEWEAKLGKANSEVQIVKNRIEKVSNTLNSSKLTKVNITDMEVKSIYENRLQIELTRERNLLKIKEDERDKVKDIYLQKSIDRKVIDKLKDKSLSKYKKELLKDDIKFIDEINNASKLRETMLGGTI